jgi:hypothetical protein
MTRTWRNQNTIPVGYKVRDGKGDVAFDKENNEYWPGKR